MDLKTRILNLLKEQTSMKQLDISEAIYGDRKHGPNVYGALKSLVDSGIVKRTGSNPSFYSLTGTKPTVIDVPKTDYPKAHISRPKTKKVLADEITNSAIEETEAQVMASFNYGNENRLITRCLRKFPFNTDPDIVAMKIALIDITNSTRLSGKKNLISVDELAKIIVSISYIDERIKDGDPEVVNEIARSNGKVTLFSFASKYCCYHNKNYYGRDDYSIYDSVVGKCLPRYFDDVTYEMIQHWRTTINYKAYNDYITRKLDELGIDIMYRKRKFDHFVWYRNKGKE
jgi:DNA-binding Lrp family transcriptional regulator